jgi:hypothetical protein
MDPQISQMSQVSFSSVESVQSADACWPSSEPRKPETRCHAFASQPQTAKTIRPWTGSMRESGCSQPPTWTSRTAGSFFDER